MPEQMRVAIGLPARTEDWHFMLARQMGCEEVVLATPADLPGEERWEYEDHFGPRNQIVYVHLRAVEGEGDHFQECFIGEGLLDVTAVVRALAEVGYSGLIIDDHAPRMVGDEDWHPRPRCYQTGFLMGLVRAVTDSGKKE